MKQISKLFVLLVIIPIVISCHSISNNITGTYSARKNPHKFVINADSTFNYFYIISGEEKFSSGKWHKINKNTIVLNSNIQSNVIPLDVDIEHSDNKELVINLKLIIPEKDEKEYHCAPQFCVSGNFYEDIFLPDRGSYSYPETNFYSNERELFFKVTKDPRWLIPGPGKMKYYKLGTERKKIKMNDGDIINITVNVPDSLFSYRIFKQEKIKVNGKKMKFRDKEKNNKLNKLQKRM